MASLEIKHCIACEIVREERGSALSLLGFYGLLPDAVIPLQEPNTTTPPPSLAFLFKYDKITGVFALATTIKDPEDHIIANTTPAPITFSEEQKLGYLILTFLTIEFRIPGIHTLKLSKGGQEIYRNTFNVAEPRPISD